MVAARTAFTVTLSGEVIADIGGFPSTAAAFVDVLTDGTIQKTEGVTETQIDGSTDWIIPNSAANSMYEVRFTNLVGDALTTPPAAEDVWVFITEKRSYGVFETTDNTKVATFDLEIRLNGGPVLSSASYQVTADNDAP